MMTRDTENLKKESDVVSMENSIFKFIASLGLDSSNFSIYEYTGNTMYYYSNSSKFKCTKSYSFKLTDISLLDTIINKCFEFGMDNISITQVGHSQSDSLQNLMLHNALKAAQIKAKIISETLGINLGQVISVNESYQIVNYQDSPFFYNDYELKDIVVAGYGVQDKSRIGSSVSLQKIQINKTVIVKYNIQ
jgi:uncharacterized protein YggE